MISGRCLSVSLVLSVRLSVTSVYCGQTETTGWIKMPLGKEIGLGPGHIVLDGDPAPHPSLPPKRGHPQFLANACCGETAGWIKMPVGSEIDLGPSQIVLNGDPAPPFPPPKKGHPNFWPMSVVKKRMDGSICHLVWK